MLCSFYVCWWRSFVLGAILIFPSQIILGITCSVELSDLNMPAGYFESTFGRCKAWRGEVSGDFERKESWEGAPPCLLQKEVWHLPRYVLKTSERSCEDVRYPVSCTTRADITITLVDIECREFRGGVAPADRADILNWRVDDERAEVDAGTNPFSCSVRTSSADISVTSEVLDTDVSTAFQRKDVCIFECQVQSWGEHLWMTAARFFRAGARSVQSHLCRSCLAEFGPLSCCRRVEVYIRYWFYRSTAVASWMAWLLPDG